MPVGAEGRVEHQKRTQTATTLWPFGFVFGVQLGLLEKRKRGVPGSCRTGSYEEARQVPDQTSGPMSVVWSAPVVWSAFGVSFWVFSEYLKNKFPPAVDKPPFLPLKKVAKSCETCILKFSQFSILW